MSIVGHRDAVRSWMGAKFPGELELWEKELNELSQGSHPGRLKRYRDLYDNLQEILPKKVWMTQEGRIHEVEPTLPLEECTWCIDEPDEEAHLCPRCGGTGMGRDAPLMLDPLKVFLVDPVRYKL